MGRALRGLAPLFLLAGTGAAVAEQCNTIADENLRLACWDKEYPPVAASEAPPAASPPSSVSAPESIEPGFWYTRTGTSQMDDSKEVYITVQSEETIPRKFGGEDHAELMMRCSEHTTAVTLQLADHFMADIQGYGTVTYRIDQKAAQKKEFTESTDNSVLGLWSGGTAIPFIKSLFGAKQLIVRATPFNESAIEVTFNINSTEDVVKPLRQACKW